ncbi:hypothetical protein ACIQSP_19900 [Streptomyces nigra]|uniref:hypothetical protein n=1 Tax=Streptomyces nigra TaxID=1827580 RepID=UPI0038072A5C
MSVPYIPDGVLLRGGPYDGRILPLLGDDPFSPADVLAYHDDDGRHVYTPRPLGGDDDGPLWLYVYLRTEPLS